MTTISPIQPYQKKKSTKKSHAYVGMTGWGAGAGMVLTMASGYTKNKNFKKQHKNLALFTTIMTIAHVLLTKFKHSKKKSNQR